MRPPPFGGGWRSPPPPTAPQTVEHPSRSHIGWRRPPCFTPNPAGGQPTRLSKSTSSKGEHVNTPGSTNRHIHSAFMATPAPQRGTPSNSLRTTDHHGASCPQTGGPARQKAVRPKAAPPLTAWDPEDDAVELEPRRVYRNKPIQLNSETCPKILDDVESEIEALMADEYKHLKSQINPIRADHVQKVSRSFCTAAATVRHALYQPPPPPRPATGIRFQPGQVPKPPSPQAQCTWVMALSLW